MICTTAMKDADFQCLMHVQNLNLHSIYETQQKKYVSSLTKKREEKPPSPLRHKIPSCIALQRALYYHLSQYSYQMRNAFFLFIFFFSVNVIRQSPLFHDRTSHGANGKNLNYLLEPIYLFVIV